jgi:hypothetical protein
MNNGTDPGKKRSIFDTLLTGSSLATILTALIGQAVLSIAYQITNNEQQASSIRANEHRIIALEVESHNQEERLNRAIAIVGARLDNIDIKGTRALDVVSSNQQRVISQVDRLNDRMNQTDTRVAEVQGRGVTQLQGQIDLVNQNIKRIDEQQTKMASTLDDLYKAIQSLAQYFHPNPDGSSREPILPRKR